MAQRGLVVDLEHCTGCHACEVACKQEHGYRVDQWGIHVEQVGPYQGAGDRWTWNFVPTPTDLCNLCRHRTVRGLVASCEAHCPTRCIRVVDGPEAVSAAISALGGSERTVFFNK